MNRQQIFVFIFYILIGCGTVSAQADWTLQKDKDGIKISSRKSATSIFNDIRVELDLPGNTEQLIAILQDVGKYKDWSYATKKAIIVKQTSPGKLIYYTEIEVPWPATNRYFYASFELNKNPTDHSVRVVAVNLPDYEPATPDLVKVPFTKGVWNITQKAKNLIHIDYFLEMNPGGSLPAWVLNLFSTKGPLETFENLKKMMTALNP